MLVVFSFCHKDADLALKQARWVKELGGVQKHQAVIVCNVEAKQRELDVPILEILSQAFSFAEVYVPSDQVEDGWPQSPNHMWVRTVQFVRDFKNDVPFLWMEADATPRSPDWLDVIEAQFTACRKPFMGDRVLVQDVPLHMSGIAVYHQTWKVVPAFSAVHNTAWDVALSRAILPEYHQTKLIQHEWKPENFKTLNDLKRLRDGAVIYHQCKDGSLIDRLRESRGSVVAAQQVSSPPDRVQLPAPQHTEPEMTVTQKLRFHIGEIKKVIGDYPSRKNTFRDELRIAGLLGEAKKRMKKTPMKA